MGNTYFRVALLFMDAPPNLLPSTLLSCAALCKGTAVPRLSPLCASGGGHVLCAHPLLIQWLQLTAGRLPGGSLHADTA